MTNTPLERRRFQALLGRMRETLAAPTLVTYTLINREQLIEIEQDAMRGLLRHYFDGVEMNTSTFTVTALEQGLRDRPPLAQVRLGRHAMGSTSGIRWYIDRVIDVKHADICVVWADFSPGQAVPALRPAWVGDEITEDPRWTPLGLVLQACEHLGIAVP